MGKTGSIGRGDDMTRAYCNDIDPNLLTAAQELDLGRISRDGAPEQQRQAQHELVVHNLRLVLSIAPRFVGRGVAFLDLVQAGNEGLLTAASKYDYRMGRRFSTYATFWIRQAMFRAIEDQGTLIRIPVHAHQAIREYNRVGRLPENQGRRQTSQCVQAAIAIMAGVVSLDTVLTEDAGPDTLTLGGLLIDGDPLVDEQAGSNETAARVQTAVDQVLHGRELRVIRARYGLDDGRPRTLNDLARELGCTRERVRQIQLKAEERLRDNQELCRLAGYELRG